MPQTNPPGASVGAAARPPPRHSHSKKDLPLLMLGAIGVVYGDIGTSPIYALRECFAGKNPIPVTAGNVLGVLSLVFWTLVLVISLKYMVYVLRADNRGEGGIFALIALFSDSVTADRFVWGATWITVGYFVSRGLAKATRVLEQ